MKDVTYGVHERSQMRRGLLLVLYKRAGGGIMIRHGGVMQVTSNDLYTR